MKPWAQSRATVADARRPAPAMPRSSPSISRPGASRRAGGGRAVAALASEAGRLQVRPREAFTRHIEASAETFLALLRAKNPAATRADALLAVSALAGAVVLARAVSDPALSDEIPQGVRERLVALAGPGP